MNDDSLSDERRSASKPSKPAEWKTNRLKRKALRSACVSKSQGFICYAISIGGLRYSTVNSTFQLPRISKGASAFFSPVKELTVSL